MNLQHLTLIRASSQTRSSGEYNIYYFLFYTFDVSSTVNRFAVLNPLKATMPHTGVEIFTDCIKINGDSYTKTRELHSDITCEIVLFHCDGARDLAAKHFTSGPYDVKEAEKLCTLDHPNLMRYHFAGELPGGQTGILREFSPYGSLERYLLTEGRTETISQLAALTNDILHGLDYLHKHDIIHGSIHPSNIMLFPTPSFFSAKLCDMENFSRKVAAVKAAQAGFDTEYTRWFMSPEMQLCGETANPLNITTKTDIWSTGHVILYMFIFVRPLIKANPEHPKRFFYRPWYEWSNHLVPDVMPWEIFDLIFFTAKQYPDERPSVQVLLQQDACQVNWGTEHKPVQRPQADVTAGVSTFILPSPQQNENTKNGTFGQVTRAWVLPGTQQLQPEKLTAVQLQQLMQNVTINHAAVLQLIDVHFQSFCGEVLTFSAVYPSEIEDTNLTTHMETMMLSWTEIRTYCLDILEGLHYLEKSKIISEPVSIQCIRLCNQHRCGIYQKAKILLAPPLLNLVGAEARLELLGRYASYWFAPEELTGYSNNLLPKTNIWHFGQILLVMVKKEKGRCLVRSDSSRQITGEMSENPIKISDIANPLPLLQAGYQPQIPPYLPAKVQNVLQECFQAARQRPTAARLMEPATSLFTTADKIAQKIIARTLPQFTMEDVTTDETAAWAGPENFPVLERLGYPKEESFPNHLISKLILEVPAGIKKNVNLLLNLRNADRDYPVAIIIRQPTDLSTSLFSSISDLVIELIIMSISNFNGADLRELQLYNVLTLRFTNCQDIVISRGDLDGFSKLRSLEFNNSTLKSFAVSALDALPNMYNLDLTGNLCRQPSEEICDYIERLLTDKRFRELRDFISRRRFLIDSQPQGALWQYQGHVSARIFGHFNFLF
ncbi:uncharacterized protein LOC129600954 [Paramacrobiotus metropolitanus]|uniref:uncharacterized protein LOC129600954 n=1 Tax=Paramacrobiotus metropolitanus TaxID=2943436 RepID=UPI002445BE18|nr:uncharacterized protein LOC129600954 [Paramacrobiotus metropolitanus]